MNRRADDRTGSPSLRFPARQQVTPDQMLATLANLEDHLPEPTAALYRPHIDAIAHRIQAESLRQRVLRRLVSWWDRLRHTTQHQQPYDRARTRRDGGSWWM